MMSSFWRNRDHHHPILGVAGSWLLAVCRMSAGRLSCFAQDIGTNTLNTRNVQFTAFWSVQCSRQLGTTVIVCTTLTIILHSYRVLYTFGRNDGQFSNESVPFENWVGRLYNYIAPAQLLRMKNQNDNDPHPLFKVGWFCVIQNYYQVLFGFQFRRIDFVNMYVESWVKKSLLHWTSLIMRFNPIVSSIY